MMNKKSNHVIQGLNVRWAQKRNSPYRIDNTASTVHDREPSDRSQAYRAATFRLHSLPPPTRCNQPPTRTDDTKNNPMIKVLILRYQLIFPSVSINEILL